MGYRNFIYDVKMMHRRCGLAESISEYPRRLDKNVERLNMYCKFYLFALAVLDYQTLRHLGYLNMNSKPHKKASTLSCVLFLFPWPLGCRNRCLLMWKPKVAAWGHPGQGAGEEGGSSGDMWTSFGPWAQFSHHWFGC